MIFSEIFRKLRKEKQITLAFRFDGMRAFIVCSRGGMSHYAFKWGGLSLHEFSRGGLSSFRVCPLPSP